MSALATTLQAFFTDRLLRQRQVSPNTVQAYRDTLRLLLVFASERHGKAPGKLDVDRAAKASSAGWARVSLATP